MATTFGLDYAWSKPSVSAMQSLNVKFVCRYLSYDTSGKNLTKAEAQALSNAGIWCVVVWETTANRALSGRSGGRDDALSAQHQATACGMPDDRPIYFAVDFDATAAQQDTIHAYIDGAASVLGRDRVGMYAGYGPIRRAFDAGKIAFGWQTYAWSGGKWDARAQIQQYRNGVTVGGADCDYDRAMYSDYGQWKVGESPMALSTEDLENIRKYVWSTDTAPAPTGGNPDNPTWLHVNILRDAYTAAATARDGIKAVAAAVAALGQPDVDESAIVAGVLAGLDPEAFAAAVAEHLGTSQATAVLDALRARLES